ncbi:MAG: hypothetical protein BJG00_001530 [Limnothrix sp. CACIAM 69d]|nr:MAG: hypothetical protein BJG00_001530 [Limnothrix sp. CACIAM 69d]
MQNCPIGEPRFWFR